MSDARLTSLGEGKGPIVLQGAMEMEVAPFIKRLKGAELEVYGDFFFWRGTFGTRPLIIRRPASARPRLVQQRLLPALFISPPLS